MGSEIMIKTKLKSLYSTLTKSEKKIADYILSEDVDLQKITSYDLARITNVSQPTVIRFSQKLEFSSFNNMVKGLSADAFESNQIKIEDNIQITNNKIISQYEEILSIANELNSPEDVEKAIDILVNSKTRAVFGVGASLFICDVLAAKLNKIGLNCIPMSDSIIQTNVVKNLGKGDVLICISQSGDSIDIIKAAHLAKEQGASVIAITKLGKNKLTSSSDVVLKTAGMSSNYEYCATTLKVAQLCITDMLYINILKSDVNRFEKYTQINENND